MKRTLALAVVSALFQTPAHALSSDSGPTFFNATDRVIVLDVSYSQGSGLRGDLAPGQVQQWPFAWQVETIKVQLKNGGKLSVSQAQAAQLRGNLTRPATQVWIIDRSRVCVVPRKTFSPTNTLHCPRSK